MRVRWFLWLIPLWMLGGCGGHAPVGLMGAYRFDDGEVVSIRASADDCLRYRILGTGETGRLYPEGTGYVSGDGFAARDPVKLRVDLERDPDGVGVALNWSGDGGPARQALRVGRDSSIDFESDGARLHGRLTLPEGPGPHPAVILVHGSGEDVATRFFYNGDFLAAHGVAAFVYDKRGTGQSAGKFTFDFHQLARDAAAAFDAVRQQADIDASRVGISGYSQGGWVAPLAASMRPDVAFVLVSCGLIASPAEEARVETREKVVRRGVDPSQLEGLEELTAAAVQLVASGFREGWDDFHAIKKHTRDAPWRKHLAGTPQASLLRYPKWLIRIIGPGRLPKGMPWYYDSMEILRTVDVPMVWFLAGEDLSAPIELTVPFLRELIEAGKPYEMILIPDADHSMIMFEEEGGVRTYTAYAPGYFEREVAEARRLAGL